MTRLRLPTVTLCAATSVNVAATLAALRACLEQIDFAECLLLTDAAVTGDHHGMRIVPIERLESSRDYSAFMLTQLVDHVRTAHCLVVQWDGFVRDASQWDERFLDYDYIGAPWPQFDDAHTVGNGGFSLRSRKLLAACKDDAFKFIHPEDIAICRTNRPMLESCHGIRFADRPVAERFSFERGVAALPTFGFHGVFNLVSTQGPDEFWMTYRSLDDPSTAFVDFGAIWSGLGTGRSSLRRRARLAFDRVRRLFGR